MSGGPLELRALLLLVSASAAFTALCPLVYRRDPGRRKLFLAALAVALLAAPWWSTADLWTWPVALNTAALDVLARPVPWIALGAWWGVGTLLAGRTLLRVVQGRRRLLALPPLEDPATVAECRRMAAALGVPGRPVRVLVGPSACASSLGGPLLILPPSARRWSADTRRAVLAHELAHLKRLDDRLLLLVRLLTDWYWWMPWLISVRRRYVEAMEESCDDLASTLLTNRACYVEGLVAAARSLTGVRSTAQSWPSWVSLLGHSHLAARVHRLITASRPTLNQADGRWALLWATVAFALAVTARPSAIPDHLPATARTIPLTPVHEPSRTERPRVETSRHIRLGPREPWRPLPDSARTAMPVYPAQALEQGLEGRVTVEVELRRTPSGVVAVAPASMTSSDPTGVLAEAVDRALARASGHDTAAGVLAVSDYNNELPLLPPGTRLRLRTTYAFVLGSAGGASDPSTRRFRP